MNGISYIYKITNRLNGKIYVGKTDRTLEQRWKEHKTLGRNYDHHRANERSHLHRAMKSDGIENFQIELIEQVETSCVADREVYWIQELNSRNPQVGYNIQKGGDGGSQRGRPDWSSETFQRMSQQASERIWINDGEVNRHVPIQVAQELLPSGWQLGMVERGIEWRQHIQEAAVNRSKEYRDHISQARQRFMAQHPHWTNTGSFQKGRTPTNKGRISITNGITNKFILPGEPIPEGWVRGSLMNIRRKKGSANE